jgi:hypothetical protein
MAPPRKSADGKKRSFHQELVLNRWMLGFFKGGTLGALKMRLGDDRMRVLTKTARPSSSMR